MIRQPNCRHTFPLDKWEWVTKGAAAVVPPDGELVSLGAGCEGAAFDAWLSINKTWDKPPQDLVPPWETTQEVARVG